jgi:hypothetical protein
MTEDSWKIIEDFPNYEVSTFGNVRNKVTNRILHLFSFKTHIFKIIFFDKYLYLNIYILRYKYYILIYI